MFSFPPVGRSQTDSLIGVYLLALPLALLCLLVSMMQVSAQGTLPSFPHVEELRFEQVSHGISATHFALAPPYLYTADGLALTTWNLTQPQAPQPISTFSLPTVTNELAFSGTVAYILTVDNELLRVDYSDVTSPTIVSSRFISITHGFSSDFSSDSSSDFSSDSSSDFESQITGMVPHNGGTIVAQTRCESACPFEGKTDLWFLDPTGSSDVTQPPSVTVPGLVHSLSIVDNILYAASQHIGIKGVLSSLTLVDYQALAAPEVIHTEYGAWRHDAAFAIGHTLSQQQSIYLLDNPTCNVPYYYIGCTEAMKTLRLDEGARSVEHTGWFYDPSYTTNIDAQANGRRYHGAVGNERGYIFALIDSQLQVWDGSSMDHTTFVTATAVPTESYGFDAEVQMAAEKELVVVKDKSNQVSVYEFSPRVDHHVLEADKETTWQIGQQGVQYVIPAQAVSTPLTVSHTSRLLDSHKPLFGELHSAGYLYQIAAAEDADLNVPIRVTIDLTALQVEHLVPADLAVYAWTGTTWEKRQTALNLEENMLFADLTQIEPFTVMARARQEIYMPLIR